MNINSLKIEHSDSLDGFGLVIVHSITEGPCFCVHQYSWCAKVGTFLAKKTIAL